VIADIWRWEALVAASGGRAESVPDRAITGFSIDSRTLIPGDVFIALKDVRDGHDFVPAAFARGAAAAVVVAGYKRKVGDGALIRVADPLGALEKIGRAARSRLDVDARVVAITGSAGKTTTKEMLRACLERLGPTHAADKSYNNHWGVPLSLARMPTGVRFAVFEIGMNHAGEITPLTQMVRPHVALITNVYPVHLGHFANEQAIAEAKAEILLGLEPNGAAVLNRDNQHSAILAERAKIRGARIVSFGIDPSANARLERMELHAGGSTVYMRLNAQPVTYRLAAPGEHYIINSLAVLAAIDALAFDVAACLPALATINAPIGRGARTLFEAPDGRVLLIDESYNANPASVRAALAAMATTPRRDFPRRIAVLGDMLELGASAGDLHRGLKDFLDAADVDLVFACGPMMRLLFEGLPPERCGGWAPSSTELVPAVLAAVQPQDVVMIKGSLGTNMAPVVQALKARFQQSAPS
jgi:UDP-N-acetylmuramoyl-tripeptide--D-alanyl-D-alanine ligase